MQPNLQERLDRIPYKRRMEVVKKAKELSGVAQDTFYRTIRNENTPNLQVLIALKEVLGLSLDQILDPDCSLATGAKETEEPQQRIGINEVLVTLPEPIPYPNDLEE